MKIDLEDMRNRGKPIRSCRTQLSRPQESKVFYSKLFQWQLEDVPNPAVPDGRYTIVKVGEGIGGGIMRQVPGGLPGWLSYVGVEDVRAATKKLNL